MKVHWSSWVLFILLSPIYIPLLVLMFIGDEATNILNIFAEFEKKIIKWIEG